jgi:hypothetical protein
MMKALDSISWLTIIVLCVLLGGAPFVPEPHIVEKLRMLFQGTLSQPIDIFDLLMHGAPFLLLAAKLARTVSR